MGYNFPNDPAVDDVFTPPGEGPTWVWNGIGWTQALPEGIPGPPGPTTWDGITDKPATFPPTLPIAQSGVTNLTADLASKENTANKGAVNGYASLDGSGFVPSAQLPSYVDDVREFADLAALPATGTAGIIYITLDTNLVYRWSGSAYIEIVSSPGSSDAVPEGTVNKYYTDARAVLKEPAITAGTDLQYWRGDKTWQTLPISIYGSLYGYLFNTSTTPPPASGGLRLNNATQSAATIAYLSFTTEDGVDLETYFAQRIQVGDIMYVQDRDDPTKWQLYEVSGAYTDSGTYASIPVVWMAGGAALTGQRVVVSRESAGAVAPVGEAPNDGILYARKNTAWAALPNITVASSAPGSPAVNDVWIDTT
jgi:hypothetical protein